MKISNNNATCEGTNQTDESVLCFFSITSPLFSWQGRAISHDDIHINPTSCSSMKWHISMYIYICVTYISVVNYTMIIKGKTNLSSILLVPCNVWSLGTVIVSNVWSFCNFQYEIRIKSELETLLNCYTQQQSSSLVIILNFTIKLEALVKCSQHSLAKLYVVSLFIYWYMHKLPLHLKNKMTINHLCMLSLKDDSSALLLLWIHLYTLLYTCLLHNDIPLWHL